MTISKKDVQAYIAACMKKVADCDPTTRSPSASCALSTAPVRYVVRGLGAGARLDLGVDPIWVKSQVAGEPGPCPLYPRRTCAAQTVMSASGQKRTSLFNRADCPLFSIRRIKAVNESASLKFIDER
jgi:hypothetical protein